MKGHVAAIGSLFLGTALVAACSSKAGHDFHESTVDAAPPKEPAVDGGSGTFGSNDGCTTSITGKVYDPAGLNPLYNVIVYLPQQDLDPLPQGVSCERCGTVTSGKPKLTALTNSRGEFELKTNSVSISGDNVPLVMQIGKWRREITIPHVDACKANPVVDKDQTRLPKNKSEGDLPQMALLTGSLDPLECLVRKIGVDDAEFTNDAADGRVHLYKVGGGGSAPGGSSDGLNALKIKDWFLKYDMVLMSCDGQEPFADNGAANGDGAVARKALYDYANAGGKVFGTHYHYYWFKYGPTQPNGDFTSTADWSGGSGSSATTYDIDTTFPKGQAFADWLMGVGASSSPGKIDLGDVRDDVGAVMNGSNKWIYTGNSTKYLSFNTPVGLPADQQCGRAVFSDVHVSSGETAGMTFPKGCSSAPLTPQEKALEFLFFDLSSCVTDETKPPGVPK